jgi:AcrR family transcriptional regulator
VSIGTLYQYLPSKQALLYALAERHVVAAESRLRELFDRLRAQAPPFEETARTIITVFVDLHSERPELHRVLEHYSPRVPETVRQLDQPRGWCALEVAFHLERCGYTAPDLALTAQALVNTVDTQIHRAMLSRDHLVEHLLSLTTRITGR